MLLPRTMLRSAALASMVEASTPMRSPLDETRLSQSQNPFVEERRVDLHGEARAGPNDSEVHRVELRHTIPGSSS